MGFSFIRSAAASAALAMTTVSGLAGPAAAQARPDSLAMSCDGASRLVASRGAVVIGTGPHVYDRFVASRRFCQVTEFTEPAWIRTRDTQACAVGYRCKEGPYDFYD